MLEMPPTFLSICLYVTLPLDIVNFDCDVCASQHPSSHCPDMLINQRMSQEAAAAKPLVLLFILRA